MAGFLKRLFKFGKKDRQEEAAGEAVDSAVDEAESEAQEEALAVERENAEAEALQAEERAAEQMAAEQAAIEEAERQAEALAVQKAQEETKKAEAAEAKRLAEEEAAQAEADKQALAKQQDAKRKAEQAAAQEAAEKAAEEQAAQDAAEEAARLEQERLAKEKAQEEEDRLTREAEEQEAKRAAEAAKLAEPQEAQAAEAKAKAANEAKLAEEEAERLQRQDIASKLEEPEPEPEPEQLAEPTAKENKSWFSRLKDGLTRSSTSLTENITAVFTKRKLDEDTLQELEDILIQADLGIETAMNVTDKLASQRMGKDVSDEEVRSLMADEIEAVLDPVAAELELDLDHTPHVILVVGVNGSGKTTTIGKLSQKLYDAGFSTLLVAGDTFRAAAIEQLKIWGERTQSPVVSRPLGSDAAGLAFDAFDQARNEGRDVMLMDTAGRLQNKTELMDELEKIIRVLRKQDPTAPHTVLLTLDATTGQNALNQVEIFKDVAGVNGLVMTKLDGTARGGILVSISSKHKLPVYFLGVGESVEDLEPFEARDFARSIAGLEI